MSEAFDIRLVCHALCHPERRHVLVRHAAWQDDTRVHVCFRLCPGDAKTQYPRPHACLFIFRLAAFCHFRHSMLTSSVERAVRLWKAFSSKRMPRYASEAGTSQTWHLSIFGWQLDCSHTWKRTHGCQVTEPRSFALRIALAGVAGRLLYPSLCGAERDPGILQGEHTVFWQPRS